MLNNQVVVLQLHDCLSRDSHCYSNNSKCLSLCCNSVCPCHSGVHRRHRRHRRHQDNLFLLSCKDNLFLLSCKDNLFLLSCKDNLDIPGLHGGGVVGQSGYSWITWRWSSGTIWIFLDYMEVE